MARESFHKDEKLLLWWSGLRRVAMELTGYALHVVDLHNGHLEVVHGIQLKYCHDASLNKNAIILHIVSFETGMRVEIFTTVVENDEGYF